MKTAIKLFLPLWGLLVLSAIIFSCKKAAVKHNNIVSTPSLIGNWGLTKTDIYEIAGQDSAGQPHCIIISSQQYSRNCTVQFKSIFTGAGFIGKCDTNANFTWRLPAQDKLQVNDTLFYNIIYLTNDSVAFAHTYIKDILKLKEVTYYKRK